jgi:hypothetical protein
MPKFVELPDDAQLDQQPADAPAAPGPLEVDIHGYAGDKHPDKLVDEDELNRLAEAEKNAPAADVPAGYAELPPDAPAETGNLSGMTDDEVRAYVEKLPEEMRPGLSDAVVNGATAGIPTELASIVSTIGSGLRHPIETFQSGGKNLADAYHDYRKHNLALLDYVRLQHPNLATLAARSPAPSERRTRSSESRRARRNMGSSTASRPQTATWTSARLKHSRRPAAMR